MTRTRTTAYCLIASACVLAALLFVQISHRMPSRAQAEMVARQGELTILSAQAAGDGEIVYVLNSELGQLLAYVVNPETGAIEMVAPPLYVGDIFRRGMGIAR